MVRLVRTNSGNTDFKNLVKLLDADLAVRDGDDHDFYHQFNTIDALRHVVVLYEDDTPCSCGAIKEMTPEIMEVKRMYTLPDCRGKGFATRILTELEKWAAGMSYGKCVLETGKKQPEAIRLYKRNNYKVIPNYGPYQGIENSVCFEKVLNNL